MEKPVDLLAELVEDAELVAAYGQRGGRLQGVELVSAIAAVKRLALPQWSDAAVLGLQTALNRAVQDIAPVLVSDLRDKTWKPFDPPPPWYRQPQSLAFVALSLVLLALTSCSSMGYNKGISLNDEITQYLAKNSQNHISDLATILMEPKTTDAEYHLAVQELREINESLTSYAGRTADYLIQFNEPGSLAGLLFGRAAPVSPLATQPNVAALDLCGVQEVQAAGARLKAFRVAPSTTQPVPVGQSLVIQQIAALCNESIRPSLLFGTGTNAFVYQIRDRLDPWRSFYLPALYGAFGATVFYMRRILDPVVRNPPFIRFAIRVAMGAFAGVIVTWFWAPNNQLLNSFSSAGLTLFTVAFLIGFGVEVLFVLLDRLVGGAMAVARGTEGRPAVIAPVYVSTEKPVPAAPTPSPPPEQPPPVSPTIL